MNLLTIALDGHGEVLPVFSFEEEAELFLWFTVPETDWQARETTAGELASVLCGPYAGVEKVALDLSPEIVGEEMAGLVSLRRKDFLRHLLYEGGEAKPRQGFPLPMASTGLASV